VSRAHEIADAHDRAAERAHVAAHLPGDYRENRFFSKAAAVTFGGAYAVLAYVGQQAVETYGWLRPIAAGAFLALFRWKLGMLKTLALSAAAGLVWYLVVSQ
jgi:chromate transport protein ChrA